MEASPLVIKLSFRQEPDMTADIITMQKKNLFMNLAPINEFIV
jgi:hypothetical protein